MLRGLAGQDAQGRRMLLLLLTGFLPAAVIGLLAGSWVKSALFGVGPVVAALAVGGLLLIVIERHIRRQTLPAPGRPEQPLSSMTLRSALIIGLA